MLTQGKTKQIWRENSEHAFQNQLLIKNLTCRTVGHVRASKVFNQAKKKKKEILGLHQAPQKIQTLMNIYQVWGQL